MQVDLGSKVFLKTEAHTALRKIEGKISTVADHLDKYIDESDIKDAMFTKKNLGGTSCAACHKNIVNLEANIAEH